MNINTDTQLQTYEAELAAWHAQLETSLRSDTGWLTLAGLHWLHEGENTVGSDPTCDVPLPADSTPERIGTITLRDGTASILITTDETVTVDDQTVTTTDLRNDNHEQGPSLVRVRGITFFVIKREDQYGIRVRDINNPARQTFAGRRWYPTNPALHVTAQFHRYAEPRRLTVITSTGLPSPMNNLGWADFMLDGHALRLEAFEGGKDKLWFIFRDATSGKTTYGSGRFMYASLLPDDQIDLDFNRAYSPPCAFTPYATCPLPPKENHIPLPIEAGEIK
ncbi:MAG: DUF1684 domain-containing protein [Anaerolineae bacterium]|nr:DUF1684 domain-containing protein [Anaerolineae bacterium]